METAKHKPISLEIKDIAHILKYKFEERVHNSTLKECNSLTVAQSHIIGFIYFREDHQVHQSELEKAFCRKRSTISGILQSMEKDELITRYYSQSDARTKIVKLTDKAISLQKRISKVIDEYNQEIESCLTPQEVETLLTLLEKVKNNI